MGMWLSKSCSGNTFGVLAIVIGATTGLVGSLVDSVLGATLQKTRVNKKTGLVTMDFRRPMKGEQKSDFIDVCGLEVLDNHQVKHKILPLPRMHSHNEVGSVFFSEVIKAIFFLKKQHSFFEGQLYIVSHCGYQHRVITLYHFSIKIKSLGRKM